MSNFNEETMDFEESLLEEQLKKEAQRQEVQDAIQRFLAKGKQIQILPPQKVNNRTVIGGDQWENYESINEVLSSGVSN
jgi:hypothetical protein